jgi:predicted dehydrogenase
VLAPVFVPATALGRGGRPAPSERITLGCIGMGGQGKGNMRSFLRDERVQVLAVCDVDRKRLLEAKAIVDEHYSKKSPSARLRGCDAYHEFERLLDREDIDAVSIATPDHWHALNAIMAARAGKDIYCEKPLALTIPEGRAICEAVHRYGRIWQTGSWQRSKRDFRLACELVRNGRIGRVHTVRVGVPKGRRGGSTEPVPVPENLDYDRWLGPAPFEPYTRDRTHYDFRWTLDYSGGVLTDWGAHHCDIAHWGMGMDRGGPVTVEGKGDFPTEGLWNAADTFFFECGYENGVTVTVSSRDNPNAQGVRFEGDAGWVFVSRDRLDAHPRSLLRSFIRPDEVRLYRSTDHVANFLDCVRSRAPTATPVEIAHRSVSVAHLGNIAMRLGRKVRWDPAAERFVDDPEADRLLTRPMREPWRL